VVGVSDWKSEGLDSKPTGDQFISFGDTGQTNLKVFAHWSYTVILPRSMHCYVSGSLSSLLTCEGVGVLLEWITHPIGMWNLSFTCQDACLHRTVAGTAGQFSASLPWHDSDKLSLESKL